MCVLLKTQNNNGAQLCVLFANIVKMLDDGAASVKLCSQLLVKNKNKTKEMKLGGCLYGLHNMMEKSWQYSNLQWEIL